MEPLWTPSPARAAATNLAAFGRLAAERHGLADDSFDTVLRWSVDDLAGFWDLVWDFCEVRGDKGNTVVVPADSMPATRFFPDARLNFAENLLLDRSDEPAIIAYDERGHLVTRTRAELADRVARLAAAFRTWGVGPGDRVAGWIANIPQGYETMLAAATVGATFTSVSPDFGTPGVLDRFGQVAPKVLVATDGYFYNGRHHSCLDRLGDVVDALGSLEQVVLIAHADESSRFRDAKTFEEVIDGTGPHMSHFEPLPFDHPLYILYSSGTTGAPKCIVHRAGGALLKHALEQRIHCDVRPGDRVYYFTTAGWMMWNWLAGALGTGAAIVTYDGSPGHPDTYRQFELVEQAGVTLFGTSAKFLDSMIKAGVTPQDRHDLTTIRTVTSTGSPLSPAGFEGVYQRIGADLHLASISGGTDLCGCLVGGIPTEPVRIGEIQGSILGMDIAVLDDDGRRLGRGEGSGELVCGKPFPSMPIGFWDDEGDTRYLETYFERFPGFWHQGDYAEWTTDGGMVIHGRSDATLNPGGVRIGTAEIYRQVEAFDEVVEGLVIGQSWDDDTRIVLFVVMADGVELTDELADRLRSEIRRACTPRHVPARIVAVPALPRTRSGKIVELAVRDVVHGRPVKNRNALENPEALEYFADLAALST